MSSPSTRMACSFFATFALVTFVLNWLWEMAQMRAYKEMADVPWTDTLAPCTRATFGDVALAFAIYGIGALATADMSWGIRRRWNVLVTATILGGILAAAYEWYAQAFGRWSYTSEMPIVPLLGVGLWPFLQLMVTVPAAFWAAQWFVEKKPER